METVKNCSKLSEENFEKILEMNPHIESVYVLMTSVRIYFDSVTGISDERVTKRYEVVLFLEDGGYTVIDGVKYDIHKGNIRFLRPNQRVYSKKFGEFVSFSFSLANKDGNVGENEFIKEIPTFMYAYNLKAILIIFKEISAAKAGDSIEDALLLRYKIDELMHNLYKISQSNKTIEKFKGKNINVIEIAIEYMETHISDNIGLEEISKHVNLHPVYFNRIFSKSIGTPPIGYLKKLRLERAMDLLLTTNYKVVDIAKLCGFTTSSYFISQFNAEMGCTRTAYRAANNYN